MARRTPSSRRWLARQRRDPYSRSARSTGAPSRAIHKLEELDRRFSLLQRGQHVLELGAAPGGWTAYVARRVAPGRVVACDPRPFTAPAAVVRVEAPFGDPAGDRAVAAALNDRPVDLVLSDMAPNISGIRAADQAQAMGLADLASLAAREWLRPGGAMLVKLFQGEGVDSWVAAEQRHFRRVRLVKPKASRAESREIYGVCLECTRQS